QELSKEVCKHVQVACRQPYISQAADRFIPEESLQQDVTTLKSARTIIVVSWLLSQPFLRKTSTNYPIQDSGQGRSRLPSLFPVTSTRCRDPDKQPPSWD